MMKKLNFIMLFTMVSIFCHGQNDSVSSIMQKKSCWCDSMLPYFSVGNYTDTISYQVLIKTTASLYVQPVWNKGASPGYYGWGTATQIDSYEITINNGRTKTVGNGYRHKFKKEKSLRNGGTIRISNCRIKCWVIDRYKSSEENQKNKPADYTHMIKNFVFQVLPKKNIR